MNTKNRSPENHEPEQVLDQLKVLDFGWALAGNLTTKHLADHGAKVVKIESSKRLDLLRINQMVSMSKPGNPDDKPWFTYYNTSKYGITLDLKHPEAKDIIRRLILWADVINENFTPGTLDKLGFGYDYVKTIKPEIIMVSGSAYGQTGPLAREWGIDSTGSSLSGHRGLSGWPDRRPVNPTTIPYGDILLPYFIALAIVSAMDYKRRTGKGQYIDLSMLDILSHKTTPAIFDWVANKKLQVRNGNRIAHASPHGVFPCQGNDRWCAIAVFTDDEWTAFCHTIGNPSWSKEQRFATLESRKRNEDELEAFISDWTRRHSAEKVMRMMQDAGVSAGVVQNAEDLLEHDKQLKERGFLLPLEHPEIGVFGHPTPPYKLLKSKSQVRRSPCLGEHNEYVCKQFLGMSDDEFKELAEQGLFM
ncbi:CaiB/BaiF CoA transferase family protein [Thermodesulfobacteriota bacterium]